MPSTSVYIRMLVLSLAFVCSKEAEGKTNTEPGHASFTDTILHDGHSRTFKVYVPSSYSPSEQTALVIALHGYGNVASEMEETSGWNKKAEKEGCIVVYPNGFNYANSNNETQFWNAGNNLDKNKINDVGFISSLIDTLCNKYNINSKMVYATGFSNGASMCYSLGNELPCKIAAIAPHSGYMFYRPDKDNSCKVPVLHIHGKLDGIVKYDPKYVEPLLSMWDAKSKKQEDPQIIFQNSEYTIKEWPDSGNRFILLNNGKHDWFTLSNSCIEANDFIWDFFIKQAQ